MFKRILIPTDGSTVGSLSALEGISMAEKYGAEVFGIFVPREMESTFAGYQNTKTKKLPTKKEYEASVKRAAKEIMKPMEDAAKKAGVKFTGIVKISNATARTIVSTAEELECNLIFMGSHGCAGWGHNLLGSVATKVLSSTHIPTLIYRLKKEPGPEAEKILGFKSKTDK